MNKKTRNYVLGTWASGGVPLFFFVFVYFSYQLFWPRVPSPFGSFLGESIFYLVFGFCLISGVLALVYLPFPYRWLRVTVAASYLVVMPGLLFLMGLFAACANGDCL